MASKASSSSAGAPDTTGPSRKKASSVSLERREDAERQGLLSGESVSPDALEDEPTQPRSRRTIAAAAGGIILLLLGAAFGPALLRLVDRPKHSKPPFNGGDLRSNGTHDFKRTVLMVSIDGLRAEYLERGLTPHLLEISRKGLRAKWMQPIFPTLTFPNHWALMTGLYAESHGIVANNFWDPESGLEFHYNRASSAWNSSWWFGEPMWETAGNAGIITANLMWPGPPITSTGAKPSYFVPWRDKVPMSAKLNQIVEWIDLPLEDRPQLIMAYEPSLDQAGHLTGPNSALVNHTLSEVDRFAHSLHHALEDRSLSSIVDIIVVSDHGMTDTSHPTFIWMDSPDLLGPDGYAAIAHEDGWPSMGLRFRTPDAETKYLAKLRAAAEGKYKGCFDVYTRETMPERYHFAKNERIAPVYVVPRMGYALTTREEGGAGMSKGNHGYDNEDESMHAMFVAHGPFSGAVKDIHRARRGLVPRSSTPPPGFHSIEDDAYVLDGFRNVEVYGLVMDLLGVDKRFRAPTNGTDGFWDKYL